MNRLKIFGASILAVAMLLLPVAGNAQVLTSGPVFVTVNFTVGESVTISATPASVTLLPSGVNYTTAATPITVSTSWALGASRTRLEVCQALSSLGTLPGAPANYFSSVNGGAASTFTGNGGFDCTSQLNLTNTAADVLSISGNPISPSSLNGTNVSTVVITTSGLGSLAVGTYAGTVEFEIVTT